MFKPCRNVSVVDKKLIKKKKTDEKYEMTLTGLRTFGTITAPCLQSSLNLLFHVVLMSFKKLIILEELHWHNPSSHSVIFSRSVPEVFHLICQ